MAGAYFTRRELCIVAGSRAIQARSFDEAPPAPTSILFRFMSRYVFGHEATIDAYLRDLGGQLGQSVAVTAVS